LTVSKYLAHSANEAGFTELLCEHLVSVSNRAASSARVFGSAEEARLAGLLHDLGKYGDLFQLRLAGKVKHIDHWSAGAWTALTRFQNKGIAAALAVQGHHVGLRQANGEALRLLDPIKLAEHHPDNLTLSEEDTAILLKRLDDDELQLPDAEQLPEPHHLDQTQPYGTAAGMLDIRMLYSALVDADFIETEAHFQGDQSGKCYRASGPPLNAENCLETLLDYLRRLNRTSAAASAISDLRSDLLQACLKAALEPPGLFTLSAPTGSGKTLSMLAFALKHAATYNKRRIIVVIPYLSIIEQTVAEFRKALAGVISSEVLDGYILENHSLAGTKGDPTEPQAIDIDADSGTARSRLLSENWDAPIIVTTSVQFLESLFANRPGACRKLHRVAESVVLFDEVQTLPTSLAVPTLGALSHMADRYGTAVVFATATQPAFKHLDSAVREHCSLGWQPHEIVSAELKLFQRAKRTEVLWPASSVEKLSWAQLAGALSADAHRQSLCVVNLKKHALNLFAELKALCPDNVLHLSTNMCPAHRQEVLAAVRTRLQAGEDCRLISTQCVEAGVDIDFPHVFRAWGPLDSMAQAAGRCNRHGLAERGIVHIFIPEDNGYPDGAYRQAASIASLLCEERSGDQIDLDDPELFQQYYQQLYDISRPAEKKPELTRAIRLRNFVDVADEYRIIRTNAVNVLTPYDKPAFEELASEARTRGLSRRWMAEARPHCVSIFRPSSSDPILAYLEPVQAGRNTASDEWFIYLALEHYSRETGLMPPQSLGCLIA